MKKKGLTPINKRAELLEKEEKDKEALNKDKDEEVFGMGDVDVLTGMPVGCTTIFDTGWETNPRPTTPIGNCVSSARDFVGCSTPCWWPAQTPDSITNFPEYQNQCAAIEKDWRNLNFVIKR